MAGTRDILYGRRPVREALRGGRRPVLRLWLDRRPDDAAGPLAELERLARAAAVPLEAAPRARLDRLARSRHHQGVVAEVPPYPYTGVNELTAAARNGDAPLFLLALDHLQDPQNTGALLRTAECAGVQGVILARDRAAGVTAAVAKASAGATERLPIARVVNLVRALRILQDRGARLVGVDAAPEAVSYDTADLDGPLVLVLGAEGTGLKRLTREACDLCVRIPMQGAIESLNVSAAGAVALYEVLRRRAHAHH
jgi:23S rRNA (guanosine2251-2'-O)-methyltransferase